MKSKSHQKEVFLESEADAWFDRNHAACQQQNFEQDSICSVISEIIETANNKPLKILEIGCGEGLRLAWLAKQFNVDVYGIDLSKKAVASANKLGVKAKQGAADQLQFKDGEFDVVVFGFCLYLCDREDLFRIAQEADRVLKSEAWIVIHDFFSLMPTQHSYHHKTGLYSYKMDYRKLFDWHPNYQCYSHKVAHHTSLALSDDPNEWVATSVLRKRLTSDV